jgi:hypothetical protein
MHKYDMQTVKRNCIKVNQITHLPMEKNGSEIKGAKISEAILLVVSTPGNQTVMQVRQHALLT